MQDNFKIGQFIEWKRSFCLNDVRVFSELSKDINPVHLDEEFASSTQFRKPIVHGVFVASMFSAIIANQLPGPGSIYLHQTLDFRAPVYHEMEVISRVEIISIRADKPIFELLTTCRDKQGKMLIEGKAIVMKK